MTRTPTVLVAKVVQPIPTGMPPHGYVLAVLIGLDVFVNAILGGQVYQTLSCRVGESIASGGWASRVPWPAWWVRHCSASIYTTVV